MTDHMGRTLADAIKAAGKLKDELPHIVQVYPSDHDTIIMAAEIERLRGALLWIRGVCAEELDLEYTDAMRRAFQRNVRDAALKALTHPEAGQPWLRTYDAHLKGTNNAE